MTKTFKDIYIGYIAALVVVLVLVLFVVPASINRWIRLAAAIVLLGAIAFVAVKLTQKRILAFNEPIENCRMREGIANLRKITDKTLDENSRIMFRLNEATALTDLGEYDEALGILDGLKVPEKHSPREMYLQAIYQYEQCRAHAESGDPETAEMHLTTLNYILGDLKFREPMLSRMIRNAKMADKRLDLLADDYEGAYDAYKDFIEKAESLRVIVACRYRLAEVCLHDGRYDEALENMEFVAKYGGDTVYAKKARLFLAEQEKGAEMSGGAE